MLLRRSRRLHRARPRRLRRARRRRRERQAERRRAELTHALRNFDVAYLVLERAVPVGCTVDATGFHADAAGGVSDGDEGTTVVLRDGDFLPDGVARVAAAR